jgi:hypothetical protein
MQSETPIGMKSYSTSTSRIQDYYIGHVHMAIVAKTVFGLNELNSMP